MAVTLVGIADGTNTRETHLATALKLLSNGYINCSSFFSIPVDKEAVHRTQTHRPESPKPSKMKTLFHRLVRIETPDGTVRYAECGEKVGVGDTVQVYNGSEPWDLQTSEEEAEVAKVNRTNMYGIMTEKLVIFQILCPLSRTSIFYGVGLNYKQHIAEANMAVPNLTVFTRPPGQHHRKKLQELCRRQRFYRVRVGLLCW